MKIPFIDLKTQYESIKPKINDGINRVLDHGQYIMGPEVKELEKKLAAFVGVKHCITASSGTDTLLMALMALGIKAGDEVITTPFTFIATGEMIALLGAIPVFVDIDPRTYNIDPAKIEAAITPKTKAIMPVSLYGQCADMDAINEIANKHSLPVIEDAAQSFGATYKGKKSCALSTIGSTSFFPSKPLGCYGDGGALFTDDDNLAKIMCEIRLHGQDRHYHHPRIGINGRMDTIQAAVLLAKMDIFPAEVDARQRIAKRYSNLLASKTVPPFVESYNQSVFAQYTLLVNDRVLVQQKLQDKGIPTAIHYPIPLNLQPVFKYLGQPKGTFPIAEDIADRVISLPMSPYLSDADLERIATSVFGDFMSISFTHSSANVSESSKIGEGSKVWINVQIREQAEIGVECIISKDVYIDHAVKIGNRCKIQNSVSVYNGVTIEDDVFIGPNVSFTNDKVPRAFNTDWKVTPTLVQRGASIGANATIVCGIVIGQYAMVAAGSVVTKTVPNYALVMGNPAKIVGYVCQCGTRLDRNGLCKECGKTTELDSIGETE